MAELQAIETWAGALLHKLQPGPRRRMLLDVARMMRTANARRMKAQRSPDGDAWERRKRQRKAAPIIRYVYKARDGHVRELEMSSYRREGGRIVGYDKEARGIRTMLAKKESILRKVTPQHGGGSIRARTRKAQQMMQGLATPRNLRATHSQDAAVVEFARRAERIAAVHHWGKRDRVTRGGPEHTYPARPLLGIAARDAERIRDTILEHLAGA